MFDQTHIQRSFNRASKTYDTAAAVAKQLSEELVDRLDYLAAKPKTLLDVGSGTGFVKQALKRSRFKKAYLIECDFARDLLSSNTAICANTQQLPIKTQAVDLVVSNLCLPFVNELSTVFAEWQRVLSAGSPCVFTTLGPDTLIELRQAFAATDDKPHIHTFYDMHDVGDALLKAGFAEPVMDVDRFTVTFPDFDALIQSLKQQGISNAINDRSKGLFTPNWLTALKAAYPKTDNTLPVTLEIIYGCAFATGAQRNQHVPGEVRIDLKNIVRNS